MPAQLIHRVLEALQQQRYADALRMSRELAQAMPGNEAALSMLAVSEQHMGNLDAAVEILRCLVGKYPGTWQHWNNLGNIFRAQGTVERALDAYRKALTLQPNHARLRTNIGLLYLNRGEYGQAREHLLAACDQAEVEPSMWVWAAVACHADGDETGTKRLLEDRSGWADISAEARLELGGLLLQMGRFDEGQQVLKQPFMEASLAVRAAVRRALSFERINQLDAAVAIVDDLPSAEQVADPKARQELLNLLATLAMRRKDYSTARRCFVAALALDTPWHERTTLWFGLARACDRLDDTQAAMEALAEAHRARALPGQPPWQPGSGHQGDLKMADQWVSAAAASSWRRAAVPETQPAPVFVVGFPRSGTTLLEQILSAHPTFRSMDERPFILELVQKMASQTGSYPENLASSTPQQLATLRQQYWDKVQAVMNLRKGMCLIDKNPLNMLALPMIMRLFPHAQIIFCQRHPGAAILSCYQQNFQDPELRALCASLERLAYEYVAFHQHWQYHVELLQPRLWVVRYEDLVTDLDAMLAKLGVFLGISDTTAMKNFQVHAQTRGYISTPSYTQVIEPISQDAVDRWRRYASWMQPLLPHLQPVLEQLGYEA